MAKIATRIDAIVTEDVGDVTSGGMTRIVAYDPNDYDVMEVVEEEARRERAGEDMERIYLKTLAAVDVTVEDDASAADWGDDNEVALAGYRIKRGRCNCCAGGIIPPRTTSGCRRRWKGKSIRASL